MTDEQLEPCIWTLFHYRHEDDSWVTSCGRTFCFPNGSPAESEYKFCPVCGKTLAEYVPDDGDEDDCNLYDDCEDDPRRNGVIELLAQYAQSPDVGVHDTDEYYREEKGNV